MRNMRISNPCLPHKSMLVPMRSFSWGQQDHTLSWLISLISASDSIEKRIKVGFQKSRGNLFLFRCWRNVRFRKSGVKRDDSLSVSSFASSLRFSLFNFLHSEFEISLVDVWICKALLYEVEWARHLTPSSLSLSLPTAWVAQDLNASGLKLWWWNHFFPLRMCFYHQLRFSRRRSEIWQMRSELLKASTATERRSTIPVCIQEALFSKIQWDELFDSESFNFVVVGAVVRWPGTFPSSHSSKLNSEHSFGRTSFVWASEPGISGFLLRRATFSPLLASLRRVEVSVALLDSSEVICIFATRTLHIVLKDHARRSQVLEAIFWYKIQ